MRRQPSAPRRVLTTVLFTDIVGSTERAAELGDRQWRQLQAAHHRLVRRALKRFEGREIDTAGDGFFATFDGPAQAVRCASALAREVRSLGLEIRAGIHLGEVESGGESLGGIAVHIGARVAAQAGPGEVLVTATVKDGVTGSDLRFYPWGTKTLKGVPGEWTLFRAEPETEAPPATVPGERPVVEEPPDEDDRPPWRRRPVPIFVGLAATVALVAGLILVWPGGGTGPEKTGNGAGPGVQALAEGNAIARIDPATGKATRFVSLANPSHLAVGEAGLWATQNNTSDVLAHIDPADGHLVARIPLAPTTQGQLPIIAVAEHAVWISDRGSAHLLRVDPATNEVYAEIPIPLTPTDSSAGDVANTLAAGYGSIWVLSQQGWVTRVDPQNNEVTKMTKVSPTPLGIAAGEGGIWVSDALLESIIRLDPHTGRVAATLPIPGSSGLLAAGEGAVWVLDTRDGIVTRVDPRSGAITNHISVGGKPLSIAVGGGSVWVTNSADGTISRIDPVTDRVTTIQLGGFPLEVTFGDDAAWVAVQRPRT